MKTISLEEAYYLLKKFKYVRLEEDVSNMKVSLNDEGLIITLKNKRETSVMMFSFSRNASVDVYENLVVLHDNLNWEYFFEPLVNTKLV